MESSEEEDDFPSIESIIPQLKIDSVHQSLTEKGIRKLCCELLDLKDAVENFCGDMRTKYLAFLRISEEAVEMEHELVELRKHISAQGFLVQDLMAGVCCEMDDWNRSADDVDEVQRDSKNSEVEETFPDELCDPKSEFLEKIDVLLAEHKEDEALEAMDAEERNNPDLKGSAEMSPFKSAFMERKTVLEDQLIRIAKQPSVSVAELKHALNGLIRLGKGPSAHHLLLKFYASRLHKRIETFLPSCSVCTYTFPTTLSRLVFNGTGGTNITFSTDSWNKTPFNVFNGTGGTNITFSGSETQIGSCGNRLIHHLSLPTTFTEKDTVEKFLHFQGTTVPCKVRAKRGFATHPRSIAERVRRNRISQRMKKLQDLFPDLDKQTSTSDMLDMAVDHIKELQKQVKALDASRAKCRCHGKGKQN